MNKQYKKQIERILAEPETDLFGKSYDFNGARRAVFGSGAIMDLMRKANVTETREISSGVSDAKAFLPYLKRAAKDLVSGTYYRAYYPNKGEETIRIALACYENMKFDKPGTYEAGDFCLTEGSTGAISALIEYVARTYPGGEALITNPCYYLYRSACRYFGLRYREVSLFAEKQTGTVSFTAMAGLLQAITDKTRLIILNNPFNPSGEIYRREDIDSLLRVARARKILVLVDELFSDLVFEPKRFVPADSVARPLRAMDNVVIVKGYSKNKNLVALRLGYLFSKNRSIMDAVARITQVRQSFPSACNYTGMLVLDSFIQSVLWDAGNLSLQRIRQVRKLFPVLEPISGMTDGELLELSRRYGRYARCLLRSYSEAYDASIRLLKPVSSFAMPKISAFNTFVKIPLLDRVNMFDFTVNLYVTTGVKIEIGPCFGFSQKDWEEDPSLGFWLRITFAKDIETLRQGIGAFVAFARQYRQGGKEWISTGCRF